MTLSVIVIAKNEADVIRRCLDSVAWADERILLDSGSTDGTPDLARGCGARVETTTDWPGFGPQKNRALALVTGDWVLSLDADEWVTPELRAEIERAVQTTAPAAWRMPRSSSYCGRFMRHSGWWPDYVVRLFRRGAARFSDDLVHERLVVEGATGTLGAPLMHEAIRDLADARAKMESYSTVSAEMLHQRGVRASHVTAVLHGAWTFVRTYVLRAGFLDGREGLLLAVTNAGGTYYRYVKLTRLWEKQRGEDSGLRTKR